MDKIEVVLNEISDETMKQITQQMAQINIEQLANEPDVTDGYEYVSTLISGMEKDLVFIMQGEHALFCQIAHRMSRGSVAECEMSEYISEFFNVFCGKIISMLNQRMKRSARFHVPKFSSSAYQIKDSNQRYWRGSYQTEQGKTLQIIMVEL